MSDLWTDRLSEYLDEELSAEERAQVEAHLERCPECRQVLQDLEGVVGRAFRLVDREPRADLWPGVQGAIRESRVVDLASRRKPARRFSFSVSQLVAAAAALVLVSGGTAYLVAASRQQDTGLATIPQVLQSNPEVKPVVFDRRGRADSAITELQRILDQESGRLDSTTVRVLTENLALIDRAIGQARKALESDPQNPYLNDHLARTMRKKIEVLRRAADLAQAAS